MKQGAGIDSYRKYPSVRYPLTRKRASHIHPLKTSLTLPEDTMKLATGLAILSACATSATAQCKTTSTSFGFTMQLWNNYNCAGTQREWVGAGTNTACDCYDVDGGFQGNVSSFVFTANTQRSLGLYYHRHWLRSREFDRLAFVLTFST